MSSKTKYITNFSSFYDISVSIEKEGDPLRVYLHGKLRKAWATEIGKYMINLDADENDWDWYELNRIPKVHKDVLPLEGVDKEVFYEGCREMADIINGKYYEMLKSVYMLENEMVQQSGYTPWAGEQ
jgi:hypothetical protein